MIATIEPGTRIAPLTSPILVLYADDSPDNLYFLQVGFGAASSQTALQCVHGGRAVVDYLSGHGKFGDRPHHPWPTLILLDVKMTDMGGLETLERIRAEGAFADIPVIMLTSSGQSRDVQRAFAAGADAYLVKPGSIAEYRALARALISTPHTVSSVRQAGLPGHLPLVGKPGAE